MNSVNMPKISVIVPVYKVEPYLRKCVDSILAQTFTDFELLLVDDGSPDNCGAICDAYAEQDNRVRVFHKPNGGVSSARNLGLDNAMGEWIAFVDSDDWVEPTWLSLYMKTAEADIIFGGCVVHGTEIGYKYCPPIEHETFVETILRLERAYIYGYSWMKIFRSSIIREHCIRMHENISYCEDHIFTLEFCLWAKNVSIVNIQDENLLPYHYILRENSLVRTYRHYSSLYQICYMLYQKRKSLQMYHPSKRYEVWYKKEYDFILLNMFESMYSPKYIFERKNRLMMLQTIEKDTMQYYTSAKGHLPTLLKYLKSPYTLHIKEIIIGYRVLKEKILRIFCRRFA